MRRNWLAALVLIASLGLVMPTLAANHGKDKDKDKGKSYGNHSVASDDEGWDRHYGYESRVYRDSDGRPPGWSRGKKTGWGNCGMPPGQAKKYGCRTYTYQGRPHYYYQDDNGRIIVRRPIVEVRGSVDIVR